MNRQMKKNLSVALSFVLAVSLSASAAGTMNMFGNAPLFFEANAAGEFFAQGGDCGFAISPSSSQMVLQKKSGRTAVVKMEFSGANPFATVRGENELPGKINYLVGDKSQWQVGQPTFSKVRVGKLYPGIDLVYHGNQKRLEYDFEIAPGANPKAIQIHFSGAEKISINAQGELILTVNGGEIRQPMPEIFQIVGGEKNSISGGYKILDARTISFAVGDYNHSLPLVIDPTIAFSTYFGGTGGDIPWAVAWDAADSAIYVAGQTFSKHFYTNDPAGFSTPGAFQQNFAGGKLSGDGFVAKFSISGTNFSGTNLIYLTYLGGSGDDSVSGVAVDSTGDAYVAGFTASTNFPTLNALYPNLSGKLNPRLRLFPGDAFVAELDPSGSNLIYSTYLGGSGSDAAIGIAVDAANNAYVTGLTTSTNFPVQNPLQLQTVSSNLVVVPHVSTNWVMTTNLITFDHLQGTNNAFITEIGSGGAPLIFSSYLGGKNFDTGEGIAVDTSGYIYVAGYTDSTNFPATNYLTFTNLMFGTTNQITGTNVLAGYLLNGSTNRTFTFDAFVTKLQPSGAGFVYSTLLGGNNNDYAFDVACDNSGSAYVTGYSSSTNFPNTAFNVPGLRTFVETNRNFFIGDSDVFLTRIDDVSGQATIGYSALFGGQGNDIGYSVAVDSAGEAFVTGSTQSTNFPVLNPLPFQLAGSTNSTLNRLTGVPKNRIYPADAFVTAFSSDGSTLLYSTYLGGNGSDAGYAIAVDPSGNAFVAGTTASTNFPTVNPGQNFRNGTNDTFIIEIQP